MLRLGTALLLAAATSTTHAACPFAGGGRGGGGGAAPSSSGCPFGGGGSSSTSGGPSPLPSSTFLDAPTAARLAVEAGRYLSDDPGVTLPPPVAAALNKDRAAAAAAAAASSSSSSTPTTSTSTSTSRRLHSSRSLAQVPPDWRPALGDYVPHTALGAAKAGLETILPQTQAAKWGRYLGAWKASNFSMDAVRPKTGWAVRSDAGRVEEIKAARVADAVAKEDGRVDPTLAAAEAVFASLIIPNIYGLLTRLAFHDCGPYNPELEGIPTTNATGTPPGRTGGCNGSVRYEFGQSNNLDLFLAWPWVDAGKKALDAKYPGVFSYADCIAIAASVAVAKASGPVMHVGYGRPDVTGPDPRTGVTHDPAGERTLDGVAGINRLLTAWGAFGHSPTTLTTLVGSHTFGVSSQHAPIGLLTPQSIVFSNRYYQRVRDGAGYFPSDDALRYSPATASVVEAYADDEALFFEAFTREFTAMTWWGVPAGAKKGVVE